MIETMASYMSDHLIAEDDRSGAFLIIEEIVDHHTVVGCGDPKDEEIPDDPSDAFDNEIDQHMLNNSS